MSPDLHEARVYVSVFGSEKKRTAAMAGARVGARSRAGRGWRASCSMKRTPQLAFEYDPSVEHGVRMTKLIDELAPETPSDDAPGDSRRD